MKMSKASAQLQSSGNMRLLTHNMLQCPRTQTYPLQLIAEECDDVSVEYSAPFIQRMLGRLDWSVFHAAAQQLPDPELIKALPATAPSVDAGDDVLRVVHRALMEWHVVEGKLIADGAEYRVSNGIPNLVLTEVRKNEDLTNGQEHDADAHANNNDTMDAS